MPVFLEVRKESVLTKCFHPTMSKENKVYSSEFSTFSSFGPNEVKFRRLEWVSESFTTKKARTSGQEITPDFVSHCLGEQPPPRVPSQGGSFRS